MSQMLRHLSSEPLNRDLIHSSSEQCSSAAVCSAAVCNAAVCNAAVCNAAVCNAAVCNAAVSNAAVGNAAVSNGCSALPPAVTAQQAAVDSSSMPLEHCYTTGTRDVPDLSL